MEAAEPRSGAPRRNTVDDSGSVRVQLTLMSNGRVVAGNITRTFTVPSSRVSEVYEDLLAHLQPPR